MTNGPKLPELPAAPELADAQQIAAEAAKAAGEPEKQNAAATAQDSGVMDTIGTVVDVVDLGSSVVSSIFDIFS